MNKIDWDYIKSWTAPDAMDYAEQHRTRLLHTLELTPLGNSEQSILEMGAYMQITPALERKLGYGYVRGCFYGKEGKSDHKTARTTSGDVFECVIDLFDAEKDVYPYPDATYDTVLCCELIEHLVQDPMHMMWEIHRILKPGGHLLLTTPNLCSLRALGAILRGYHPGFFPAYSLTRTNAENAPRHNREYVPKEMQILFGNAGFEMIRLETGEFAEQPHPEFAWITHMLERYQLPAELRGEGIYALGRKAGEPKDRWPAWLYQ